jgi:alpha-glucoside transport system substrate-binding protein
MRHHPRWIAPLVALALAAAACGGAEEGDVDGAQDTGAPRGTVEVIAKWTGGELDAAKQVMEAFTRKTGIRVDLQGVGDDLPTILSTRVEGGDPPDVAQLPQPGLLVDLARRGALRPIDELVGREVDQRYARIWRELGSADGKLYGVWFKGANKSTVWYNVRTFRDKQVEPPGSYRQWVDVAADLSDGGVTPLAVGAADGWVLSDWFENVYLRTAGPDRYDRLARHEIPWTDQSVKDALTTMRQLIGEPNYVAKGLNGALQTGFEDSVKLVFGPTPQAAMVYEGDFVANVIRDETPARAKEDFDFFAFPPTTEGARPVVVGGGDVVVLLTDRNPAAGELIKFLATAEAAEVWARIGGFSSPNKDVNLSVYPDDITREAARLLVEAETFRFDLSDTVPAALGATKGAGIWGRLQDWMARPTDVDRVLARLEEEARAAYRS